MDSTLILEKLFLILEGINKKEIDFVIWYGNKNGKDIDIFVALNKSVRFDSILSFPFDISYVGNIWLPTMIKHVDPIIVEPLLTGETIWGNTEKEKELLTKQEICEDTIIYFLECAEIFYDWSVGLVSEDKIHEALLVLSFVNSYTQLAQKYQISKKIVLLNDLLSNVSGAKIREYREMGKNKKLISENEILRVFTETSEQLNILRSMIK